MRRGHLRPVAECVAGRTLWVNLTSLYAALAVSHLAAFIFELATSRALYAALSDVALVSTWTVALVRGCCWSRQAVLDGQEPKKSGET